MKVITWTTKNMASVFSTGLTVGNMKETGPMVSSTVMDPIIHRMAKSSKEFGKKERDSNGLMKKISDEMKASTKSEIHVFNC